MAYAYDPEQAIAHLRSVDPRLARLFDEVGRYALRREAMLSPFESLLRAIVYQQLSGKAAASIYARLKLLFANGRPSPEPLLALPDSDLRGAGLSRAKVAAVRDLARRKLAGDVPGRVRLERMGDEAIIAQLTAIRGIGRWTVEMLLIFKLGRPDVLPATDLGVRKGFALANSMSELPKPADLLAHGECWRPFRSVATWYLWRATDSVVW